MESWGTEEKMAAWMDKKFKEREEATIHEDGKG